MRFHETARGGSADAGAAPGDPEASPEARVTARARALPIAAELEPALGRLTGLLRGLALAGLLLAAVAGAATARSAFAGAEAGTVNFYWLLASLLGLHLLSFLAWLAVLLLLRRRAGGGMLGGALLWLWRQAGERFGGGSARLAAVQALAARWARGAAGRWLASALSHGLWLAFLAGGLAMTLALLSARHYGFVWETTILDRDTYVALTRALTALPDALGIAVPDRAAVVAAQYPGAPAAGHEILWSSLLVAAILLYGLLPRALALVASVALAWHAVRASRLDLGLPYYAELVARLSPLVGAIRVVDPDRAAADRQLPPPLLDRLPPGPPPGALFLLGWETPEPGPGWPPPGMPAAVRDLGCRDGRHELAEAVAAVSAAQAGDPGVGRLVVVLDLRQSPDRGATAALAALEAAAPGRLVALFTGAAALGDRLAAADAAIRTADWVAAAEAAGIEPAGMLAVDLDGPAEASRRAMAALFGAGI